MGSFLPFLWLGAAVVLGLIEAASPMLVCIWFCLGAAITFVVSLFVSDLLIQVIVFLVASLIMLLALRPFMRKRVNAKAGEDAMNVDGLVGRSAIVTQAISAGGEGRAKLGDISWLARGVGGAAIASGTKTRVAQVDGTYLVLEPPAGNIGSSSANTGSSM